MAFKLEKAYEQRDIDHYGPRVSPSTNQRRAPTAPSLSTLIPLPNYISPPRPTDANALDILAAQGAFTVPPTDAQFALLKSFVQHVHSGMPLLNLGSLLDAIVLRDGQQVGLLLFQAVMFAGAIFVDHVHLHLMGYKSRRDALKELFTRARALYEYGCETDQVETIQALLLLTLYQEDSQCEPSFWMSTLWARARATNLWHGAEVLESGKGLWKRLWWSIYTRDRLIALDTRHPVYISDDEHNIPMLLLADFEACYATGKTYLELGLDLTLRDTSNKTALALTFIFKAKLCQYIGRILTTQYAVNVASTGAAMYKPRGTGLASSEFQDLERELDEWQPSLPLSHQFPIPALPPRGEAQDIVHVQKSMLQMLFFTAVHLLHRPSLCLPLLVDPLDGMLRDVSAWKIESASQNIIAIAHSLHVNNMSDCLPDSAVTTLLSAAISYTIRPSPQVSPTAHPGADYLQQARDCLGRLKDRYEGARRAEAFLNHAAKLSERFECLSLPLSGSNDAEVASSHGSDGFRS
ncbi:fungal-specific transcription factor domain-containing protein [Aspergillus insuetus]